MIYYIYMIYIWYIYIRNGWPYNIMTMLWPEYNRDIGRIVIPSPDRDFQPHVFGPGPKTMVFQSPTKNHGFWRVFKMNGARLDLPWFTWLAISSTHHGSIFGDVHHWFNHCKTLVLCLKFEGIRLSLKGRSL